MSAYTAFHHREGSRKFNYKQILLKREGKEIGFCNYLYFGKPFPFYFISNITVDKPYQGSKFATDMLDIVEAKARKRGAAILLYDGTGFHNHKKNIYTKRGWKLFHKQYRARIWNAPLASTLEDWNDAVATIQKRTRKLLSRTLNTHVDTDAD